MPRVCTNAFGEDFIIDFDYRVTARGCPAKLSGPPENCYQAEPMEWEAELVALRRDLPMPVEIDRAKLIKRLGAAYSEDTFEASDKAYRGYHRGLIEQWERDIAPLDVPAWLKERIENWLQHESDEAQQIVEECEAE